MRGPCSAHTYGGGFSCKPPVVKTKVSDVRIQMLVFSESKKG